MNAAPPKDAQKCPERQNKLNSLKEHIRSGKYQVDVFRVAQAKLNHVDEGVDKGIEIALAFHLRPSEDEEDLAHGLI